MFKNPLFLVYIYTTISNLINWINIFFSHNNLYIKDFFYDIVQIFFKMETSKFFLLQNRCTVLFRKKLLNFLLVYKILIARIQENVFFQEIVLMRTNLFS